MSIYVEVRTESGQILDEFPGFQHQPIISWSNRDRFPILAAVDPLGFTMLNRPQLKMLEGELAEILQRVVLGGALTVAGDLSGHESLGGSGVEGWAPEQDLEPMIGTLQLGCKFALDRYHRYLWFVGD